MPFTTGPIKPKPTKKKLSKKTLNLIRKFSLSIEFVTVLKNYYKVEMSKFITLKNSSTFQKATQAYQKFIHIKSRSANSSSDFDFAAFKNYIYSMSDPRDFSRIFISNIPPKLD
jgi:hypothetical protein